MIALFLLIPLTLATLCAISRRPWVSSAGLLLHAVAQAGLSFYLAAHQGTRLTPYFQVDATAALFLSLLAVVYLFVAAGSVIYFRLEAIRGRFTARYALSMMAFVVSMTGVILSTHIGMLWVFVELTTLTSAPFIYFEKKKTSLEATWKYVFVCSVGIALSFIGIIFVSMACYGQCSLFFEDLAVNTSGMNPFWLKFSLPFLLVGFGTKVGLAPMHAWLPDAHSEAPAPASALLSGMLLNTAFLGILRVSTSINEASQEAYLRPLLAATGFISLFVAAVYTTRIKNYKRMLAYSSIENMGIMAIGLSLGKAGIFAVALHMTAHSLAKTGLFLTSGNILGLYGSKFIADVRGLLIRSPAVAWVWLLLFAMIVAIPPSPLFISEFFIGRALLAAGHWAQALGFFFLITIVIWGMGRAVLGMAFGRPDELLTKEPESMHQTRTAALASRTWTLLPQLLILLLLIILGVSMPQFVYSLLEGVAG